MGEHEYVGAEVRQTIGDVETAFVVAGVERGLWLFRQPGFGGWIDKSDMFFLLVLCLIVDVTARTNGFVTNTHNNLQLDLYIVLLVIFGWRGFYVKFMRTSQ